MPNSVTLAPSFSCPAARDLGQQLPEAPVGILWKYKKLCDASIRWSMSQAPSLVFKEFSVLLCFSGGTQAATSLPAPPFHAKLSQK